MKKTILLFSAISIFIFFIGCGETSEPAEPETLVLNRKALSFDENESSGDIYVSSNAKWTVACSDETWLSSSVSSGEGDGDVQITASANMTPGIRVGDVTFTTAGGISKSVEITQEGVTLVTDVKIDKSELTLSVEDFPVTLIATVLPENATEKGVEWKSDAPQIAEVNQNGAVTPKSIGVATITATAKDGGGKFAACIVTVKAEPSEAECDKSLFSRWNGDPGIPYHQYSVNYGIENLWDDDLTRMYHTRNLLDVPAMLPPMGFSFELGNTYKITRFRIWHRSGTNWAFTHFNPKRFRVYGSIHANPRKEYDDSTNPAHQNQKWLFLGEFDTVKPSGLPPGESSEEDLKAAHVDGIEYVFPVEIAVPVRYIRIDVLEVWNDYDGNYAVHIAEITIFGKPNE